jgi:hypothetical protein
MKLQPPLWDVFGNTRPPFTSQETKQAEIHGFKGLTCHIMPIFGKNLPWLRKTYVWK